MKVYTRQQFLLLPIGTFFAKGFEWAFDGFLVKGETWCDDHGISIDFLYLDLVQIDANSSDQLFERLDEMKEKGTSYPINLSSSRDGSFDDSEIFLVFEKEDLLAIKKFIERTLMEEIC